MHKMQNLLCFLAVSSLASIGVVAFVSEENRERVSSTIYYILFTLFIIFMSLAILLGDT